MPRKRTIDDGDGEPVAKRRSARHAAAASTKQTEAKVQVKQEKKATPAKKLAAGAKGTKADGKAGKAGKTAERADKPSTTTGKKDDKSKNKPTQKPKSRKGEDDDDNDDKEPKPSTTSDPKDNTTTTNNSRAVSPDPDADSIPVMNPDAPRHEGEWYWLMKAEPETRLENGVDVSFSIDDLRAKNKPEGWDGIRAYAARNHMRNMNAGDKAFFYHSNCKEPGIVGTMEVVREFSEDSKFIPHELTPIKTASHHMKHATRQKLTQHVNHIGSARRPGTPYYDPQSSKTNVRWNLVHVEFRNKFAVPIGLKELRELGEPGGPLENMQMLKQSRLSVSRVSKEEWEALCELADKKAEDAGLAHETGKLVR